MSHHQTNCVSYIPFIYRSYVYSSIQMRFGLETEVICYALYRWLHVLHIARVVVIALRP